MSRDYPLPEYAGPPYAHMHAMQQQQPQPQPHHYPTHYAVQHHPQTLGDSGASSAYELTAAAAAAAGSAVTAASSALAAEVGLPTATLHPLDPRHTNASHYGDFEMGEAQCSGSERSVATALSASSVRTGASSVRTGASSVRTGASSTRKRKSPSFGTGSSFDENSSSRFPNSVRSAGKKQNHSEIEKRRRDKMNTYISELSAMIPMCVGTARKMDKLSVLRLAVAHLRNVRGALSAGALAQGPRPGLLPQQDLNALLLHAAQANNTFLFVVGCDGGRLLYASHTVHSALHYHQAELVGQSLFDILHPKDVVKVKEQLSSLDLNPRERLIDSKTLLPVRSELVSGSQRLSPGARRSFFCRIKYKQPLEPPAPPLVKKDDDEHRKKHDKKYCVVQCTGYLKSWVPLEVKGGGEEEEEQASLACLVAVCRALAEPQPAAAPPARPLQYVSRHALDGKFLFVDQRVRLALGFLPQELLGTSLYEYVSGAELGALARAHKNVLTRKHALHTPPYPFRRKDGSTAIIQTHFKPFRNPWTKEIECLVANNTLLPDSDGVPHPYEPYKQKSDTEVARLIASQVEAHKIGACIAEEAQGRPAAALPSPPLHLMNDPLFNASLDNILGMDLNPTSDEPSPGPREGSDSPPLPLDGNGEAAMAVIMSLLEADAGLGGPININYLPWSLP